jgi:probable F420-dependent oxidoreductase
VQKAGLAEKLGYSVCAMPDHVGDLLAPFPALVAAADATDSIRVGTLVLDNDFRNPVVLAQEAATVDLLTEGRLELGLGAGWLGRDYERTGIGFDPPHERFERFKEAFQIIDRYLRGQEFSFDGSHYQVGDLTSVHCIQKPRPPLLIGGGGRRLLRFAAQTADIISVFIKSLPDGSGFDLSEANPRSMDAKVELIRSHSRERSEKPELNVLLQHFEVTRDVKNVAEKRAAEVGITSDDLLELPTELIGSYDEIVERLVRNRERFDVSYITVPGSYMEEFAPIVERLAGT